MRWRVLVVLLGAGGLPAALARAQAQTTLGPPPGEFRFSLGLGGGYTSNPGLRSDDGEYNGDSVTNLAAALMDRQTSPRTEWTAKYDALYTRYASSNQFDTINHALNFDGRYLVTRRSHLNLLEHFFYSRNPLQIETTAPTSEVIILTSQTNRWRSLSDAAFDTSLSRSLTLLAGTSARIERIDANPTIDIKTYSGRLGIQKQLGDRDTLSSTYGYSRFDFHTEGIADAESHALDVAWSHGPPAGAGVGLSAGVSQVTRAGAKQNLFTAGATLHRPLRRIDLVSDYRRSVVADAGVATLTLAQTASVGVSGRVGRSSSLGMFGEYGTRDSIQDTGDRLALKFAGGALRGSIAINPRLSLSGEARRRKQTATAGPAEDLTVNTLFLQMVFEVF